MRHNLRQRTTAGLLALLAQAGVIALFTRSPAQRVAREPETLRLIFIQPLQTAEIAPPPEKKARAAPRTESPAANSIARDEPEFIEAPSPAGTITMPPAAAPAIDWYQTMESAARSYVEREAELAARVNPLDSKPRVLELPADRGDESAVTSWRLDNGDLVTQQRITKDKSVVCLHEHIPLGELFEATAKLKPAKCSMRDTGPDANSLFEDIKPGYLKKPLPLPRSPPAREEPPAANPADR